MFPIDFFVVNISQIYLSLRRNLSYLIDLDDKNSLLIVFIEKPLNVNYTQFDIMNKTGTFNISKRQADNNNHFN